MATVREVLVPDIGDFKDVLIIEVLVSPGDAIKAEDPLITLESDKATMDVPSPYAGVVKDLKVKVGDKVSEGSLILTLEDAGQPERLAAVPAPPPASAPVARPPESVAPAKPAAAPAPAAPAALPAPVPPVPVDEAAFTKAHASPSVRRFARELGVDLGQVNGSGPKARILKEDVQAYVKAELVKPKAAAAAPGIALPEMPAVDFSKFGPVETRPLSRIKKLSGANLHRNWLGIPHVTQHDEADITELEAFRKAMTEDAQKQGIKLTLLAFVLKASVAALKKHRDFNASLNPAGDALILKQYFHIGVAVDTAEGLVVPVIRDVDQKGVLQLAKELSEISARARDRKLTAADMQGACFSISSLGGIGGTAFTPIINAPEVAILGISRSSLKPVFRDGGFAPRLMLPLSLSYDHRVIDGAAAARFTADLRALLSDIRRLLL